MLQSRSYFGSSRGALALAVLAGAALSAAAGTALAAEGGGADNSASPAESASAVWTEKEATFVYTGFTTHYSCDGLRDKVRGVLLDLGAQKKTLKIMQLGCSSPNGRPDPFPGVRVKMNVLTPAGSSDSNPVPAHWQPVDLKLRDSFTTDSGECELVEQIKQKLVPLFTARNVDLRTDCIPHQATATEPTLKMEVLTPDPPKTPQ